MKRSAKTRDIALLALALSVVAVACADAAMWDRLAGTCGEVVEPVAATVQRAAPARLTSADGVFSVEIPPLAVAATTEVTLSKLAPVCAGQPATGITYVIGPEDLVFERPLRLAVKTGALPPAGQPEHLRVARRDTAGTSGNGWNVIERPERTSSEVLGRSLLAGQFALIDTSTESAGDVLPFAETSEADVLLSRGEVEAARAAYSAVLRRSADSARANLGFAVSSLLLLPDAVPLRNMLSRCGLPPLAPAVLYGDDGFLARLATDRGGESVVELDFGTISSRSVAEAVVARASATSVVVRSEDRDHLDGPWQLAVTIDLAAAGDAFASGGILRAVDFPGTLTLTGPNGTYSLHQSPTGEVRIDAAGRTVGQEIALRLSGLRLTNGTGTSVRLSGTLRDTVASAPLPPHVLFTTADDPGPPYRRAAAVLLGNCSASLTAPFLFEQAQALLDELAGIETSLTAVLTKVVAEDPVEVQAATLALLQALPSFLPRLPDDVPLNPRDLRVLIAAIDGLRVAVDLARPYRFFGYDAAGSALALADFLADQTLSFTAADGSIATRLERALAKSLLAADLSRNLLAPDDPGADLVVALSAPRLALDSVLAEAIDALSQPANGPGIFDLDNPLTAPFVDTLASALVKIRETLPVDAVPVAASGNPGYSFAARLFFEQPPTHAALAAQVPEGALCVASAGDAQGATAAARNPQLALADAARPALLATFMVLPPDRSSLDCTDDASCGTPGVLCDFSAATCQTGGGACTGAPGSCGDSDTCVGHCARAPFELIPAVDVERAIGGDAPALIDAALWRVIGPLLEALPWRSAI